MNSAWGRVLAPQENNLKEEVQQVEYVHMHRLCPCSVEQQTSSLM